ncbi:hypothetical protein L3C95_02130 [Chitinophaga filiformis]|nr:hypothetical protein [Chitinophaga filiformis]MCF6401654.1 hypothetical protein [Chitinophaga filiformis]
MLKPDMEEKLKEIITSVNVQISRFNVLDDTVKIPTYFRPTYEFAS